MSKLAKNHVDEHTRIILLVTRPNFQVVLTVFALIVILLFGSFVYLYYPYSGMEIALGYKFWTSLYNLS